MAGRDDYFSVLTAAINDLAVNGYSEQRLSYWQRKIREAAERSMLSMAQMEAAMRESLAAVYKRLVDGEGALVRHPGVQRFVLQNLRPELRLVLERRQTASRELIKLNREESIAREQRRLAGWASSLPPGGGKVDRKKIKAEIRKPMASLPFEERRVIIDQGHRLVANIHQTIAEAGNAIAAEWHDRGAQDKHYDARPDHLERSGKVFLIRGSWAHLQGFVKPAKGAGFTDEIEQPAELVYCLPGESEVPFAAAIEKAYRRWFSGELACIVTASGKTLRATPNHPILTSRGWRAIGDLQLGDYVVEVAENALAAPKEDQHQRVPCIADIFCSLKENCVVEAVNLSPASFHGDGSVDGHVDVVSPARGLAVGRHSSLSKRLKQFMLAIPDLFRSAQSHCAEAVFGMWARCNSSSWDRMLEPLIVRQLAHAQRDGFGYSSRGEASVRKSALDHRSAHFHRLRDRKNAIAGLETPDHLSVVDRNANPWRSELWQAGLPDSSRNGRASNSEDGCDLIDRLPFGSKSAKVVRVDRFPWAGHVYNLQTRDGWYVANGIITHNCSCWYRYVYALRQLPDDMITVAGRRAMDEAKARMEAL